MNKDPKNTKDARTGYIVRWEVKIPAADTPQDAARIAYTMQTAALPVYVILDNERGEVDIIDMEKLPLFKPPGGE